MTLYYWISLFPILILLGAYLCRHHRLQKRNERTRFEAIESGLAEPASLHPVIDRNRCIGCQSCVFVCPQQLGHRVLGIYHGKAELLEPANCIGHGACKKVCPVDAISLVFGTETRGVDIPRVDDNFETNLPGIFIAGELGGMGLIRNAIEQGKSAVKAIHKNARGKRGGDYQVVIVGAGPAGIAATLQAKALGLRYLTLEQDSLGGTVFKYPRGKIVMTQPADLPLVGKMHFRETSKEDLLQYWQAIVSDSGIEIAYREMVSGITRSNGGFTVETSQGKYSSETVLLAIGRRGTPRKLGVTGEDHSKVVYQLIDPEQYRGQKVLIVGGGDSALEAALAIADVDDTDVTLSYRSESFSRARAKNRSRVDAYAQASKINLLLSSTVTKIHPDSVELEQQGQNLKIANQAVIVNAGGILPTGFLQQVGIQVDTRYGTA